MHPSDSEYASDSESTDSEAEFAAYKAIHFRSVTTDNLHDGKLPSKIPSKQDGKLPSQPTSQSSSSASKVIKKPTPRSHRQDQASNIVVNDNIEETELGRAASFRKHTIPREPTFVEAKFSSDEESSDPESLKNDASSSQDDTVNISSPSSVKTLRGQSTGTVSNFVLNASITSLSTDSDDCIVLHSESESDEEAESSCMGTNHLTNNITDLSKDIEVGTNKSASKKAEHDSKRRFNSGSEEHQADLWSAHHDLNTTTMYDRFTRSHSFIKCYNCRGSGHLARDCPEPKRTKNCSVCGMKEHTRSACTLQCCFNCGFPGHHIKSCDLPNSNRQVCRRCGKRGHQTWRCPDTWRQYAAIRNEKELRRQQKPLAVELSSHYCCNCGSAGHLIFNCQAPRWDNFSVNKTIPTKYDFASSEAFFSRREKAPSHKRWQSAKDQHPRRVKLTTTKKPQKYHKTHKHHVKSKHDDEIPHHETRLLRGNSYRIVNTRKHASLDKITSTPTSDHRTEKPKKGKWKGHSRNESGKYSPNKRKNSNSSQSKGGFRRSLSRKAQFAIDRQQIYDPLPMWMT
eukprot:gene2353-25_t